MVDKATNCPSCVFYRVKPLDCVIVSPDVQRRSLAVVSRLWTAEEKPCPEFASNPTRDDVAWASAVLHVFPRSRWARRIVDCVKIKSARDGDSVMEIMQATIEARVMA